MRWLKRGGFRGRVAATRATKRGRFKNGVDHGSLDGAHRYGNLEFAPILIAGKYMDLYRRLSVFPIAIQNGMLQHSASETPRMESPLN